MAHIGIQYKVWFRRDLSLNEPLNQNGWAEAYDIDLAGLRGSLGHLFNGRWQIINTAVDPAPFYEWKSDPKEIGGREYALIWKVQFPLIEPPIKFEWRIERDDGTVMAKTTGIRSPPAYFYSEIDWSSEPVLLVHAAGVDATLSEVLSKGTAARWNSYNPP